mmetsp:Transcript_52207/g.156692  ORF Transcript_52207/g.156692 Transcript_52207/m.156692 type:complete len:495 (-) Transcript_52207:392-1876(-)
MASAPSGGLTSTTAPGKIFASRAEVAQHYKCDWHRYNLKRREAGLPMIAERDFNARLEAALAARKEREERERGAGRGHLKDKNGKKGGGKKNKKGGKGKSNIGKRLGGGEAAVVPSEEGENASEPMDAQQEERPAQEGEPEENPEEGSMEEEAEEKEEEPPKIDPYQSLFDNSTFPTLQLNLAHMSKSYGFFVPDSEYLTDLEGLLGYCHEKVKLGHTCLYCQKTFSSWEGCRRHMVDSRHCKLRYERGIDLEEFDVFYDFNEADQEFLTSAPRRKKKAGGKKDEGEEGPDEEYMDEGEDDDSAEWEDVSDDEGMEEEDEDEEGLYRGYEDELATHGYDITPLGELVFPDGRIVGHRGLSRYYKQTVRGPSDRAAVVAARRANGERVWAGRVYDTRSGMDDQNRESSLALMRAGLDPASARAGGRSAQGILVNAQGGGFTTLSLYRYRAAVRKSRRDEDKGRRLKHRNLGMNINRMDKKANRLMNGVSVAHAAR